MAGKAPPLDLLQHTPVAVLLNHLLAALNELRACAPYELRKAIHLRVRDALLGCVQQLADVRGAVGGEVASASELPSLAPPKEPFQHEQASEHFRSLCGCMSLHLLPHLSFCLDQLVPQWTPPPSLKTGAAAALEADGEADALVEAVRKALRPLENAPLPQAGAAAPAAAAPEDQVEAPPAPPAAAAPSVQ